MLSTQHRSQEAPLCLGDAWPFCGRCERWLERVVSTGACTPSQDRSLHSPPAEISVFFYCVAVTPLRCNRSANTSFILGFVRM